MSAALTLRDRNALTSTIDQQQGLIETLWKPGAAGVYEASHIKASEGGQVSKSWLITSWVVWMHSLLNKHQTWEDMLTYHVWYYITYLASHRNTIIGLFTFSQSFHYIGFTCAPAASFILLKTFRLFKSNTSTSAAALLRGIYWNPPVITFFPFEMAISSSPSASINHNKKGKIIKPVTSTINSWKGREVLWRLLYIL